MHLHFPFSNSRNAALIFPSRFFECYQNNHCHHHHHPHHYHYAGNNEN